MSTGRTRQPAGIPVGGQFATETRGRAAVSLDGAEPIDAAPGDTVSFADVPREERLEAMRAEIDAALESMSSAEGWERFLDASSKLHRYSMNNRLLIAMQKPDATMTAGFNDWKSKHGRKVKAGEKAIWVLAPVTYRKKGEDADGNETSETGVRGFRAVATFDISQTEPIEGDERGTALSRPNIAIVPLEGEAPAGMTEDLTRAAEALGYTVEYSDEMPGSAAGYTSFQDKKIVVRSSDSHRERANTLAHELGHVACGHEEQIADYHTGTGGKRPDMEVEAESTAYVISRHYGIAEAGQANFGYIDGWAHGDKDRVKATATKVVTATKKVLDIIENKSEKAAA